MDHVLPHRSLLGVGLVAAGALLLLGRLHLMVVDWKALLWGGVVLLGLYRAVVGFARQGSGVFLGTVVAGVGAYALLRHAGTVIVPSYLVLPALLTLAGAGLLLTFAAAPRRWHILIPALLLLTLGTLVGAAEEGFLDAWAVRDALHTWWPLALVLFGAALLLNRSQMKN